MRVGVQTSSYACHFLDGLDHQLSSMKDKVSNLATSSRSGRSNEVLLKCIEEDKKALSGALEQASAFLGAARFAAKDSVGAVIGLDVNLTLAQRDKFISHLYPYLAYQTTDIRYADFESDLLMPNIPQVVEESAADAQREQARKFAFHLSSFCKSGASAKPSISAKKGPSSRGRESSRKPFRGGRGARGASRARRGRGRGRGLSTDSKVDK